MPEHFLLQLNRRFDASESLRLFLVDSTTIDEPHDDPNIFLCFGINYFVVLQED